MSYTVYKQMNLLGMDKFVCVLYVPLTFKMIQGSLVSFRAASQMKSIFNITPPYFGVCFFHCQMQEVKRLVNNIH